MTDESLKNWIKRKSKFDNVPYLWENKKEGGMIEISYGDVDAFGEMKGTYNVFTNRKGVYPKKFRRKSDALEYAKRLMRL